MKSFRHLIRYGEVAPPTSRQFDEKKWLIAGREFLNDDDLAGRIIAAGLLFNSFFADLRELAKGAQVEFDGVPHKKKVRIFSALSNRDFKLLSEKGKARAIAPDIWTAAFDNNPAQNRLSLSEISNACVESIEIALRELIRSKNAIRTGKNAPVSSEDTLAAFRKEVFISGLYGVFEGYWEALVWGDYDIRVEKASEHQVLIISRKPTASELAFFTGSVRVAKLGLHSALFSRNLFQQLGVKKKFLALADSSRRTDLKVKEINKASGDLAEHASAFYAQMLLAFDSLPNDLLDYKGQVHAFTVRQITEVVWILSLLAYQINRSFPENTDVGKVGSLMSFCKGISKDRIARGIARCTGYAREECCAILDFITFDGSYEKDDLFCFPLIPLDGKNVSLSSGALVAPLFRRIVEKMVKKMCPDESIKGHAYERFVAQKLRSVIDDNEFARDEVKIFHSIPIKANGKREEIDLIIISHKFVFICELKCVSTPEVSREWYSSSERMKEAALQANRKCEFVRRYAPEVSAILKIDWRFSPESVYPLVVHSSRIHSGQDFESVPVVDDLILERYFQESTLPLLSDPDGNSVVWFKLWSSRKELLQRFKYYLDNPPQLSRGAETVDRKVLRFPDPSAVYDAVLIQQFELREVDFRKLIESEDVFEIESATADSVESIIKRQDLLI